MKTNQNKLGIKGERIARTILIKHFINVKHHSKFTDPFDFTATDKLTGDQVAIEVKTMKKHAAEFTGKLVHIESAAMARKLQFLNETNRKGIVLLVVLNGTTTFYLAPFKQHISKGGLVEIN